MNIADERNHINECTCLLKNVIEKIKSIKTVESKCRTILNDKETVYSFSKKSIQDVACDCLNNCVNYIMEDHKKITGTCTKLDNTIYGFIPDSEFILEDNHTGNILIINENDYNPEKNNHSNKSITFYDRENNCFLFNEKINAFFIIGKEVTDFKEIDTNQITAMQNVVIQHLLNENNNLNTCVSTLSSRVEALENLVLNK